jgi:MFS family permease
VSSVFFVAPPYRWQAHSLGLLALAGLIGTLLALFVGGKMIDMIANHMTKKNGGRREPEYRLPALLIPSFFGPMGLLIFGLCLAHQTNWIAPAVGYAMQAFGLAVASNILVTYTVDSYHSVSFSIPIFSTQLKAPKPSKINVLIFP